MATLTIRNLPDAVRDKLRMLAARNRRSMEAEVRARLAESVVEANRSQPRSVRERLQRLQTAFKPYRSAEGSVVDELIAERRVEGWTDNLESLKLLNSGKKLDLSRSRK